MSIWMLVVLLLFVGLLVMRVDLLILNQYKYTEINLLCHKKSNAHLQLPKIK